MSLNMRQAFLSHYSKYLANPTTFLQTNLSANTMTFIAHEESKHFTKPCRTFRSILKEALTQCLSLHDDRSNLEEEYSVLSEADYQKEVVILAIQTRAMEAKMRLKEGLVNENFDWVLPKFEEIILAPKEIQHLEEDDNSTDKDDEEKDEFFSLQSCFSSCSTASIEALFSARSCFSRSSSASRIDDLWDAWRRLMIKELCHCEGWPFGLFRKAMLLPPLPKSPSESWTWRQGKQSSKMT